MMKQGHAKAAEELALCIKSLIISFKQNLFTSLTFNNGALINTNANASSVLHYLLLPFWSS